MQLNNKYITSNLSIKERFEIILIYAYVNLKNNNYYHLKRGLLAPLILYLIYILFFWLPASSNRPFKNNIFLLIIVLFLLLLASLVGLLIKAFILSIKSNPLKKYNLSKLLNNKYIYLINTPKYIILVKQHTSKKRKLYMISKKENKNLIKQTNLIQKLSKSTQNKIIIS